MPVPAGNLGPAAERVGKGQYYVQAAASAGLVHLGADSHTMAAFHLGAYSRIYFNGPAAVYVASGGLTLHEVPIGLQLAEAGTVGLSGGSGQGGGGGPVLGEGD